MITLIYTEVRAEEIYEDELYDALIDTWTDNFDDISNINELKDCWQEYEDDILDHIYSIWILNGDIEETNLNEIFTPEFWKRFYEYVKNVK